MLFGEFTQLIYLNWAVQIPNLVLLFTSNKALDKIAHLCLIFKVNIITSLPHRIFFSLSQTFGILPGTLSALSKY